MLEAEKAESLLLMVERMRRGLGDRLGLGVFYRRWLSRQIESLVCAIWGLCMVLEILLGGGGEKKVLVMWIIVFLELMHD